MKRLLAASTLLLLAGCGSGGGGGGTASAPGPSGNSATNSNSNTSPRLLPPPPPPRPGNSNPRVQLAPKASASAAIRPRVGPLVISLQTGWNLFSVPYTSLSSFSVSDPAALLACYRYNADSGQYEVQDTTQSGFQESSGSQPFTGYWGYASRPLQLTADGTDSTLVSAAVGLPVGWNLIGTPLADDVPLSALTYNSQTMVEAFNLFALWPELNSYNPATLTYVATDRPPSLVAGKAVWMYAYQAGTLERVAQTNFNAVQDFSPLGNPSGAFRYGDLGNLGSPVFTPYTVSVANVTSTVDGQAVPVGGLQGWAQTAPAPGNTGGEIVKNTTAGSLNFQSISIPSNELGLLALASAPTVRFTAPNSADFTVRGFFDRIDTAPQPTNVVIRKNLTTTLHTYNDLNTFSSQEAFVFTASLSSGDVLDFAAMASSGTGHHAAGLNVVITQNDPAALTFNVPAKANVYGAQVGDAPNPGQPSEGQAGGGVVAPFYDFDNAVSGAHFTFPTVVNNSPAPNQSGGPLSSPDGYLRTSGGSELIDNFRGLSGCFYTTVPYRAFGLVGVFTNPSTGSGAPPTPANFSVPGVSVEINTPLLNQVFHIGDGLTGTGSGLEQKFVIPDGATRLTLGFADSAFGSSPPSGYQDNSGSLTATANFNNFILARRWPDLRRVYAVNLKSNRPFLPKVR